MNESKKVIKAKPPAGWQLVLDSQREPKSRGLGGQAGAVGKARADQHCGQHRGGHTPNPARHSSRGDGAIGRGISGIKDITRCSGRIGLAAWVGTGVSTVKPLDKTIPLQNLVHPLLVIHICGLHSASQDSKNPLPFKIFG